MSITVKNYSLSALDPVGLGYGFNNSQQLLENNFKLFNNDFSYIKHTALNGYKDVAFSKGNFLALTDIVALDKVFKKQNKTNIQYIGKEINNTNFKLVSEEGIVIRKYKNRLYGGGVGEEATVTLVVVGENSYELKIGNNVYLQVDQEYPYDIFFTEEELNAADFYKRRFEIDFWEDKMTIKCSTPEGGRYISYGNDKILRANGVYLNNTTVNSYIFTPSFVSANLSLKEDLNRMKPVEVVYFNEFAGEVEHENLFVKSKQQNPTNTLLTCSIEDILNSKIPNANIALLKNNFTASGAYTTK